jgi:hypothetical protein
MVTKDRQLNALYVQKSRDKKKEEMGADAYREMMATKQREYRAKQKQTKAMIEAVTKIQNAIRNRKAMNQFATRYVEKYYREPYMASVAGVFNQLHTLMYDDIN